MKNHRFLACGVMWCRLAFPFTNLIPVDFISLQNFLRLLWTVTMKHILTFPKCCRLCSAPQLIFWAELTHHCFLFCLLNLFFMRCYLLHHLRAADSAMCGTCVSEKSFS